MSSSSCRSYTLWVILPASWIQRTSSSVVNFFNQFFFSFPFEIKLLKKYYYIYSLKSIFRPPPLLPGSIFWLRVPLLQVLHAPLTQNCRASGWWRSPKGISRGGVARPRFCGTVQLSLRCFAAHHSQCLWSVSSGVTWAFEACLRNINKWKAVKETVHKDMAKILIIAI